MTERRHGTRTKYVHDRCRCDECVEANNRYSRLNEQARAAGVVPFVDSSRAREHLLQLRDAGIGTRTVAERSGVARSALGDVLKGNRCAPSTIAAVLRVDPYVGVAPGALVDAAQTWRRVNELLALGHTRAWVSSMIGQGGRALQLGKTRCTQRNASAIYNLWVQERDHLGVWE